MKIVLATGIYPPDIGGPATYVLNLARELAALGHHIAVITYGENMEDRMLNVEWSIIHVSRQLPVIRWFQYASVLNKHALDADVIYAFSSVSCGIPLWLSGAKKPKKYLRLGGDFLWERYTDRGGKKSLREWYASGAPGKWFMQWLLNTFDYLIFSTRFQEELYEHSFAKLPPHSVIENAFTGFRAPEERPMRSGNLRLLFMGRFVGFKNLFALIEAMCDLPNTLLTLVGDGPLKRSLMKETDRLGVSDRVAFVSPVEAGARTEIFDLHDLLILPSLTEISPNVALEARMAGLPVMLTSETGLNTAQISTLILKSLRTPSDIVAAVEAFERPVFDASFHIQERPWNTVASEHMSLFSSVK